MYGLLHFAATEEFHVHTAPAEFGLLATGRQTKYSHFQFRRLHIQIQLDG